MSELIKYKLILSTLFLLVIIFFGKTTFDFYMYLIVGIVFPIILWFVIQYSLNQHKKELEKNRKKMTNSLLV